MKHSGLAGLGSRFAVMLGGEVLQSLFHLGLNLVLLRALSAHDYGVFAMIFVLGGIGLTFVRALAGVPAATFIPQARSVRAGQAYAVTFGSGAVLACLVLAALTTVGLVPVIGGESVAAGAFVGLWSLRSYLRIALFARRRVAIAGASDLAFTLGGTALLMLLLRMDGTGLLWEGLAMLAAAHGLGIAVALAAAREPVRIGLRHTRRRYRALRHSFAWSVAGVATANVQAQGQILLIGVLAGPEAYAPIAATLVLFAPLRLLGGVVVNLIQPEMAAELAKGSEGHLRLVLVASTALLAAACLVYGIGLAAGLGLIEQHLFAGRFAGEPLGLIALTVWATVTGAMLYAAPKTLLETRRAFRSLAWTALASAVFGMALITALIVLVSPAWSMAGVAASEFVVLLRCWRAVASGGGGAPPGLVPHPERWLPRFGKGAVLDRRPGSVWPDQDEAADLRG
ncbi:hypothetical protein [Methylorubrum populi]